MALVTEGQISLITFSLGLFGSGIPLLCSVILSDIYSWYVFTAYTLGVILFVKLVYKNYDFKVGIRGLGLGLVLSLSLILSFSQCSFRLIGWYTAVLAVFHWSEYMTTACTNPRNLCLESYLLDHSKEYHLAAAGSLCEFFIEWYFFSSYKSPMLFSKLGLIIVIIGELLRKVAMFTAASNFNHYVQHSKAEGHQLITNGIYSYFRHPAYVGWFYWSLGTQLMICNPICLIGYVYASWNFFNERIRDEEVALINFFGEKYIKYQNQVPTGLPFISGFKIEQYN